MLVLGGSLGVAILLLVFLMVQWLLLSFLHLQHGNGKYLASQRKAATQGFWYVFS